MLASNGLLLAFVLWGKYMHFHENLQQEIMKLSILAIGDVNFQQLEPGIVIVMAP
ncbi:uncharacterized protein J3R85_013559 [Psidium guajava]|nr:uncharacterized protein J3R85_013559 [Psidium guajava]